MEEIFTIRVVRHWKKVDEKCGGSAVPKDVQSQTGQGCKLI